MTRNLCAHPAQLLNLTISKFCHSPYMVIITIYNSKILLSLHCFLTPQFQTFTNLIIGILGVRNPTNFCVCVCMCVCVCVCVSIIANIIIIITVLQCYWLWIFVSIRRLLQLIVCIGVSPTSPLQKHHPFFFAKPSLKSGNYPSHPFQAIYPN